MNAAALIINHLLKQEAWARQDLSIHHGKIVCIDAGAIQLRFAVTANGLVKIASNEVMPALTIRLKLADLPLILSQPNRASTYVKIEGDVDFATTIAQLAQSLRWDAEHDMSQFVGDIAAKHVVSGAQSTLTLLRSLPKKLAEHWAEYFLEEQVTLVRPHVITEFSDEVIRLRDDLERLIKRIERLEQ